MLSPVLRLNSLFYHKSEAIDPHLHSGDPLTAWPTPRSLGGAAAWAWPCRNADDVNDIDID